VIFDHETRWHRGFAYIATRPWQILFLLGRVFFVFLEGSVCPGKILESGGMNMYRPTLEEARGLVMQEECKVVPISCELFADIKTPIQVLKVLKNVSKHCYMLESMENSKSRGRYTFLGFEPVLCIACKDGEVTMEGGTTITFSSEHPDECIRDVLAEYKSVRVDYLPSFTGGLVGYFSYDYIKYAEPTLKLDAEDEEHFKDVDLMLFDKVIAFDHFRQKIVLIANAKVNELETEYNRAVMELKKMAHLIEDGVEQEGQKPHLKSSLQGLFSREEYCGMVERAKEYIREGDIFQVVLSNRFSAEFEGSLLDVYRVLRTTNPSPYMFYFSSDDVEIAGASPETLVKLEGDKVQTFPLAGTRPRGKDADEDARMERELLADEKELAEHNMLVDLGRNDLGKICRFGSVAVERYMDIQRFSHVMHIGSAVSGQIREDKSGVDAIGAVLPAGTLSGAPKIRACEIIHELELNKRGIYGGAIGYLDFTGNMDTCIAIRIAYKKNGKVFVRSGGGIVADSVPETEYQESLNKAKAVMDAIVTVEGGLG